MKHLQEVSPSKRPPKAIAKKLTPPQILACEVQAQKLIAKLNDGRELSIPLDWFAKWGVENATADKLKNYEIWRGKNIYFPDLDEVLGIEKFLNGFAAPCE
ncbi:DUF2442 domain-containing protein [endosymbiont GvMRE of Glomus versiforme]|uniref:DUF2442 domain-containing protein n=1 Tax=endosymbiont GvMRE of Glomus versiforme TaxID=2039283 RepID=UPI000EC3765C|nr:DUF2442 domain-containing protein [endosymbiont GvMRE of Glomus versiforme]RHZ36210.1 Conserved protein of unkwnown function (DUF2442 domain) [endosymbiont GvMRE of Glomus versiforme]